MPIGSPYNSFVQFSDELLDCEGSSRQARLPVFGTLAGQFQIKVTDELIPITTALYAAVCSADCELISDPNLRVVPVCPRYKFMEGGGLEITADNFPVEIGNYAPGPGQPQVPAGIYDLPAFLSIISETFDTQIDSLDFIDCCEIPTITGLVVFFNTVGLARIINLNKYYSTGYVDFPATPMTGIISPDQCFRYCILNSSKVALSCSNLFYRETNECYISRLTYYNEENGYGFKYTTYADGTETKFTKNQVWLPIYLRKPLNPTTENIFRRSDGSKQRLSTYIQKDWEGVAGYMSNEQRDRLIAALKSDVLVVENEYSGVAYRMMQEGDVTPDYPDGINTPLAPSTFRISDYSQTNINNNCGFNCGVEFIEDCDSGGGVTPACPDKFSIEFSLAQDQVTYQNDNLKGLASIEVYREGLIQYTTGVNFYSFNSITGTITFTPVGYAGERIAIVEV